MQIKDLINNWSPTASVWLLKCFLADAIQNQAIIYQLDFIQAFIQSPTKKRIVVILDKEYEMFCPQLAEHFGRPLRLKKCLYGADFSGKSWYDTLYNFLQKDMIFQCSRVEGCLYIYRKGNDWIKMVNNVDDALYFASEECVRCVMGYPKGHSVTGVPIAALVTHLIGRDISMTVRQIKTIK